MIARRTASFVAVAVAAAALAAGCSSPAPPGTGFAAGRRAPPGDGGPTYEGREIAGTCSAAGADWLERPERDEREQPERVLDLLGVGPGMVVADVGAGTGYFTVRISRRVGRDGLVLATDIQPEMLRRMDARMSGAGIENVQLIRGEEHKANLPERCCDLVLMVDVYHELADPPAVMAGIRRALRDPGRLVLVEYRGEDAEVAIKPEHKMTLAQIRRELEPMGFAYVESFEDLPDQRIVVFRRDDSAH